MTLALLAALWLSAGTAEAADPRLHWQTVRTRRFAVHFHDGGDRFAQRTAAIAEEAYDRLEALFGWRPTDDPIHLVCTDLTDGANGFAGVDPFDAVTVLAYAPEADTDLANYDDWLRLLLYHELTHVFHMDRFGGLPKVVNHVFGKWTLPNLALPQWFVEGLATWAETKLTRDGRVGSTAFEMYRRAAVLGGTLPDLSALTGRPNVWPRGNWPYLFGGDFLTYVVARCGERKLIELIDRNGRRILPYGLNNLAREILGADIPTLYRGWRDALERRARARVAAEKALGLHTGRQLTMGGETHHAPVYDRATGAIVYQGGDGYQPDALYRWDRAARAARPEKLLQCWGGCGRALVTPDGASLILIGSRQVGPHRFQRDLLRWDRRTRPALPERLTTGARAREPDLSADGHRVAYVASRWGETAIQELDLRTRKIRTLVPFDAGLQLDQPRYLPDGWMVLSGQPDGGQRDLWLRAPDGVLHRLTRDADRERGAVVSPDGHTVFYQSDRGGIWNIHALDLRDGRRFQVTRVIGGAFNPAISPDGRNLLYNGYWARGHDLFELPLDRSEWAPVPGRADVAPLSPDQPPRKRPTPPRYQPTPVPGEIAPFAAWRSAWPRGWTPLWQADQNGFSSFGLQVGGADALGHHSWVLAAQYGAAKKDVTVGGAYTYAGWYPTITVSAFRTPTNGVRYYNDALHSFHRESLFTSLSVGVTFPHVVDPMGFDVNISANYAFDPDPPRRIDHDPGSDIPFLPRDELRVGAGFRWWYDRTQAFTYSISPDRGFRTSLAFDLYPASALNDATTWSLRWDLDVYVPMPWLRAHVLALKYHGALSGGEDGARSSFEVGGLPAQNILLDLLSQAGLYGSYLRGYPPAAFSGEVAHLLTAEYRLPIWEIFRGLGTLPLFFERLTGAVYSDMALVYTDRLDEEAFKATVGAEIQLRTQWFYALDLTFRVGYAHAVTPPESYQLYVVMGSNL